MRLHQNKPIINWKYPKSNIQLIYLDHRRLQLSNEKTYGIWAVYSCAWETARELQLVAAARHQGRVLSYVTMPGKDQNSSFKEWLIPSACCLCKFIRSKRDKWNHCNSGTYVFSCVYKIIPPIMIGCMFWDLCHSVISSSSEHQRLCVHKIRLW